MLVRTIYWQKPDTIQLIIMKTNCYWQENNQSNSTRTFLIAFDSAVMWLTKRRTWKQCEMEENCLVAVHTQIPVWHGIRELKR